MACCVTHNVLSVVINCENHSRRCDSLLAFCETASNAGGGGAGAAEKIQRRAMDALPEKPKTFLYHGEALLISCIRSDQADTQASAASVLSKNPNISYTRLKRLISKISFTPGAGAAITIRPSCALTWRATSINARKPWLLMYSIPPKSRTSGVPPGLHSSRYGSNAAKKASTDAWSMRPCGARTRIFP